MRRWSDPLVAVIPLLLTVVLLVSGFTPILRTLSDPNASWTGFAYQALLDKITGYALAISNSATSPAQLTILREQALSSANNSAEFPDLAAVESIGEARLSRVSVLFQAALLPGQQRRLGAAIREAALLNEQSHERIHIIQNKHAQQLELLRAVLLLAAALSGVLSTGMIWRSLILWRREKQALALQRELLSLASHELRRPLQSLLIATDLLRTARTPEDRLHFLGVVEDSAAQLATRADLERLADMYDHVQLRRQPIDLGALLASFSARRVSFTPPAAPLVWSADPDKLRQIIENLVENALRYSPGQVMLSMQATELPEIWVQDSGQGIQSSDVERLFQPGQRGEGSEVAASGRGLGLTVARKLARAHGGDLLLEPAPSGGTRAVLRLGRADN
ncbi:sensor histidine kinase [Deinococcus ruber]|uniref:sensor histidine kinase n=1 Tax=Deinococcus ruber TaxID=1848197 RepID=UPI001665D508|nr:HAMP domain-containing sensor histidine kinase [Deinococcus ruber]